ncbi:hypothetical protein HanIR_Chr03g0127491 [Helianthus annuus]|nr:hypothetical protein HanIR_Chr03g0127491 [Helianthus annuus]
MLCLLYAIRFSLVVFELLEFCGVSGVEIMVEVEIDGGGGGD